MDSAVRESNLKEVSMAQLIVRNLEPDLVQELKIRAARHNRSAEAEHREILRSVLRTAPRRSLKEMILEIPSVGDDADFERVQDFGRKVEL